MKKNKRRNSQGQTDEKPIAVPIAASSNQQPEQTGNDRLKCKTSGHPKKTGRHPFFNLFNKLGAEWVGVVVAFIALIAAGWNIYLTREALHTSQRAFLYLKEIRIETEPHKPGNQLTTPAYLAILWENSGETPARKAVFYVESCTRAGWPPEDFSFPYTKRDSRPHSLVPPKATVKTIIKLGDNSLSNVELQSKNLIVYGTVTYLDIFGIVHTSEFCRQWNGYNIDLSTGIIKENHWDNC